MPTDLWTRPDRIKVARMKAIAEFNRLAGHRCEITGRYGHTDLHEFWLPLRSDYDDEVATVLLTHPANIVVLNHDTHINCKPGFKECLVALRYNRYPDMWQALDFADFFVGIADFRAKVRKFYETGQIKVPVSYIPKLG